MYVIVWSASNWIFYFIFLIYIYFLGGSQSTSSRPVYSLSFLCVLYSYSYLRPFAGWPGVLQIRPNKAFFMREVTNVLVVVPELAAIVRDWSLHCPSNTIWPFKIYLSQNNPSKRQKWKTSFDLLNIICPPQELTSVVGHCHYKKWS